MYSHSTPTAPNRAIRAENYVQPERWILADTRASAIPDDLALLNREWIEGDEAIEALAGKAIEALGGHAGQYVTGATKKILDRYEFARAGGWVAYGCTLDGDEGEVAYFKPIQPRAKTEALDLDYSSGPRRATGRGFGKVIKRDASGNPKRVKYETPQGCPGLPLLAWVPWQYGLRAANRIGKGGEYRQRMQEIGGNVDHLFWRWWAEKAGVITIVEGFKKAESLIAQGIPAIALRGVAMWHKAGGRELHDIITAFATAGRRVNVVFDQDSSPKTVANVRKQALALGSELNKLGCKVFYPVWDGKRYGKGIDDCIFGEWPGRGEWLSNIFRNALTLKQYRRQALIGRAFGVLDQLERLSYPIECETTGDYLPKLPPLAKRAIHVLDAAMGSGKTKRTIEDWISIARAHGWFTVWLSPMNSLGQQTGQKAGLPHIHDFSSSESNLLWSLAAHEGGVVMCPDSLHRLPEWVFQRPVLVVMDEANQICQGLTNAGTLGDRQSDILKILTRLLEHTTATGAIVLSEDGIADRAIKFIQQLSQSQTVRVFRHRRQQVPWDCKMYSGSVSGFRAATLEAISKGKKVLFVTSSQREGKRLEQAIEKRAIIDLATGKSQGLPKVVRVDSETNEGGKFTKFFNDPDQWIAENQPDVLILSPSAKSGISIEAPYFDGVWGYFPALAGDTHWQLLGRYRQPVPRHVFVPPFIQSGSDEALMSPRRAKQKYKKYGMNMAGAFELAELLNAPAEDEERLARIELAVLDYHAEQMAVQGAQKAIAYDYLMTRLQRAGHNIKEVKASPCGETGDLYKGVQEDIWIDDAEAIAGLDIDPAKHTQEWAHRTLNGLESTHIERLRANKVLWRAEFPGVLFDDANECFEVLCLDYGAMRRGVLLQAKVENLEATRELDRQRAAKVLGQDIKVWHRLPKDLARARLLAATGILDLLDGGEYSNNSPRAIAIKTAALKLRVDIRYFLRLNICEDQTPVEICNKLLRKFGLELNKDDRPGAVRRIRHEGGRGQQQGVYRVDLSYSPTRARLLEAARRKLSEVSIDDLHRKRNTCMQINHTTPPTADPGGGWPPDLVAQWADTLGQCLDCPAVETAIAALSPQQWHYLWSILPVAARQHLNAIMEVAA